MNVELSTVYFLGFFWALLTMPLFFLERKNCLLISFSAIWLILK